jgi:hypothetical protein
MANAPTWTIAGTLTIESGSTYEDGTSIQATLVLRAESAVAAIVAFKDSLTCGADYAITSVVQAR